MTVVGHSRAGPLLPGALTRLAAHRPAAVFLDARLPHDGRAWLDTLTDARRAALLGSAEGSRLPWARWFPAAELASLLPDPAVRRRFHAELPALPVALLREPVPQSGWDRAGAPYVQLSTAYAPVAGEAEAAGWPVTRHALDHLAPSPAPDRSPTPSPSPPRRPTDPAPVTPAGVAPLPGDRDQLLGRVGFGREAGAG